MIKKPPHSFCPLASTRCRKKRRKFTARQTAGDWKGMPSIQNLFFRERGKEGWRSESIFLFFDPGSPSSGRGVLQEGVLCRGGGGDGVTPQPGRRQGKVVHARPPPPPLPLGVNVELVLILLLFLFIVPRPRGGRGRHRGRHRGQVQRERGDRGGAERRRAAGDSAAAAASADAGLLAERQILEVALLF